jgi:hypothetical protein
MAHPCPCAGLKKSYSIEWKRLVSWQLRRCQCPLVAKAFQFFRILKIRNSRFFRRAAEDRSEVGLGAIATPSGVFQPEFVVHGLAESLLADKIMFDGLNRCMSKQELNVLKLSARWMA